MGASEAVRVRGGADGVLRSRAGALVVMVLLTRSTVEADGELVGLPSGTTSLWEAWVELMTGVKPLSISRGAGETTVVALSTKEVEVGVGTLSVTSIIGVQVTLTVEEGVTRTSVRLSIESFSSRAGVIRGSCSSTLGSSNIPFPCCVVFSDVLSPEKMLG